MGGGGDKRAGAEEGKGKRWLPKSRLEYIYYVLAIVVAGTVLFTFLRGGDGGDGTSVSIDPTQNGAPAAKLEPVDLVVEDVAGSPYHARLEATLHNTGGRLVVINRARIEVLRIYELPLCFSQGSLSVSGSYGVLLPADAEPGEVIEAPLHQQVGADEADRFALDFEVSGEEFDEIYLFELEVSLVNDSSNAPLPLGRALVSLPIVPGPGEYVLREGDGESLNETYNPSGLPVREFWGEPMACWRSNTQLLLRAVDAPATHSPQLAEIAKLAITPTFAAMAAGTG